MFYGCWVDDLVHQHSARFVDPSFVVLLGAAVQVLAGQLKAFEVLRFADFLLRLIS
jgi:hypothetical protein